MLRFKANELRLGNSIVVAQGTGAPDLSPYANLPIGSQYYEDGTSRCYRKLDSGTTWGLLVSDGYYGSFRDGNVTINSNTTLTRDMYYDVLTVNSTFTLNTGGYRIFARRIVCNGTIARNGVSATTASAVAATGVGSWGTGGGNSGASTTTNGNNAGFGSYDGPLGAVNRGGNGGASGPRTGGNGTIMNANRESLNYMLALVGKGSIVDINWQAFNFGAPGGGGAGSGTQTGGAGGQGGGGVMISAYEIAGSGTIESRGGNGFTPVNANGAGGGGGGGGIVVVCAHYCDVPISVAGGTGGIGNGTGANGQDGGDGMVFRFHT